MSEVPLYDRSCVSLKSKNVLMGELSGNGAGRNTQVMGKVGAISPERHNE